jgi:hypothetical protein
MSLVSAGKVEPAVGAPQGEFMPAPPLIQVKAREIHFAT